MPFNIISKIINPDAYDIFIIVNRDSKLQEYPHLFLDLKNDKDAEDLFLAAFKKLYKQNNHHLLLDLQAKSAMAHQAYKAFSQCFDDDDHFLTLLLAKPGTAKIYFTRISINC